MQKINVPRKSLHLCFNTELNIAHNDRIQMIQKSRSSLVSFFNWMKTLTSLSRAKRQIKCISRRQMRQNRGMKFILLKKESRTSSLMGSELFQQETMQSSCSCTLVLLTTYFSLWSGSLTRTCLDLTYPFSPNLPVVFKLSSAT